MQLSVGDRLEGAGPPQQPGGYVVTGVIRETPWFALYTAKKIFYNFDFTAKRARETDENEWLDVFVRINRYPVGDRADYVARRRALVRAEIRGLVTQRHSNLWPEPIDLLERGDAARGFRLAPLESARGDSEPIVVFARPHGQFLRDWQQQVLPVTSVLSVIAELLELIKQAHAADRLLLGLAPDAVIIDPLDRAHFMATDMALPAQSPFFTATDGADTWRQFFPPGRFAQGYAAPECFDAAGRPDRRSDLYSWASLAYDLLTGESPSEIARVQNQPSARFTDEHWGRLEHALTRLPASVCASWAEQLGLPTGAVSSDWPVSLAAVLRFLLNPIPSRRPGSVAELLSWLTHLPPVPVAGVAALQIDPGEAKLLVDCSALDAELRLHIRRARGSAPIDPSDGEAIYDGPIRAVVVDGNLPLTLDAAPLFYTIWTMRGANGQVVYSAAVSGELWQPGPANLQHWAEQQAAADENMNAYPPLVATVLSALDPIATAYSLLPSASPRVRGWGLRRIEHALRAAYRFHVAEAVLWRFTRDPVTDIRLAAAVAIWNHAQNRNDALLLRLLEALQTPEFNAATPLTDFLQQIGVSDDQAVQLLHALADQRPMPCPVCQAPIPAAERVIHLRAAHGYVDDNGDAVPYATAVARRWDRVLRLADTTSHERLIALYEKVTPVGALVPPGLARYVADLEKQLVGQPAFGVMAGVSGFATPPAAFEPYLTTLRQSDAFLPIARLLLSAAGEPLRAMGYAALLPGLAEQLRKATAGADLVGQMLTEVCPGDAFLEQRVRLCRQLPAFGVDTDACTVAAERFEDERRLACVECGDLFRRADMETHLRCAHGIYEFRGVRRARDEIRAVLLEAVCAAPGDPKAWRHFRAIVQEEDPEDADRQLVASVYAHLRGLARKDRSAAVRSVAETLATDRGIAVLLATLVSPNRKAKWQRLGRRLALEVASRLQAPVSTDVVDGVMPLLADRALPRKGRLRATLALLRTTGRAGAATLALLRAYVAGSGKLRAIEKLRQLEQRFGQAPAIDQLCRELEDEIRMSCPRCPTQLRKKDMIRHLWERHRLVLDGQRVREPWRVLEDWAVDYALEKDPELLQRCTVLARQIDPEGGPSRLYRTMLRRVTEDRDVLAALIAEARNRAVSLCPHCYEFVPCAEPVEVATLIARDNFLEGGGYRIEVSEGVISPRLQAESPSEIVYAGREPHRGLTRFGTLVLLIAPAIALCFVLLEALTGGEYPPALVLMIPAGFGLVVAGLLYSVWPAPAPASSRLLNAAWDVLVPHLLAEEASDREWIFLHGLACRSATADFRGSRLDYLVECCAAVGAAGRTDPVATACLAELCRLALPKLRLAGRDAIGFLAAQLADCFCGKTSLVLAGALLAYVRGTQKEWGRGALRRLQVLVAARAFAVGLRLEDLRDLSRAIPAAREVLGLDDEARWAQLQLLFDMSHERLWERSGRASSIFELADAADEAEELLTEFPPLLLSVRHANLHITSRGVWILGHYISARPADDVIEWEWNGEEQAYAIMIGPHRVRTPRKPSDLVAALKTWLHFYFDDFLPLLPNARDSGSAAAQKMWQSLRAPCRECGRPLVPCSGELGIPLR